MTPLRLMTPDQKEIAHQYIKRLSGEKLNQIAERFIPEEFVTSRKEKGSGKVGRPAGKYGSYKKKSIPRLTNGP